MDKGQEWFIMLLEQKDMERTVIDELKESVDSNSDCIQHCKEMKM